MQNQTASMPRARGRAVEFDADACATAAGCSPAPAAISLPPDQPDDGGTHLHTGEAGRIAKPKFTPLHGDSVVNTVGLQGVNPNNYAVMGFPAVSISGLTGLSMVYDGGHNDRSARPRHDQELSGFADLAGGQPLGEIRARNIRAITGRKGGAAKRVRRLHLHRFVSPAWASPTSSWDCPLPARVRRGGRTAPCTSPRRACF